MGGPTMKRLAKKVLNKDSRIRLRRLAYSGSTYHCTVCDSSVRTMLTTGFPFPVLVELDVVGAETLPDDTCPVCYANSRARLMLAYIRRELGVFDRQSPTKVLHIAPEYSILARLRGNRLIDYVAADINPAEYAGTVEAEYCDVTAMPYADDLFDLVICSHVLEHVPDDRLAMRELLRVLKPGGTAILQVPISASLERTVEDPRITDPRERERRFGQHDHVRIYGADYPDRLRESGFQVEIFDPPTRWGADILKQLRLNPRERLFLGRKN